MSLSISTKIDKYMRDKITSLTDYQWQLIEKHLNTHRKRKHSVRIVLMRYFGLIQQANNGVIFKGI